MNTKRLPIFQFLATASAQLAVINGGMQFGWSSPSLPKLLSNDSPISMTSDEASWIATLIIIGDSCGACLAVVLLDKLGRKLSILLTAVPFFTSWMMIAFSTSFTWLAIARFIGGIGDGITYTSVPIYIGEISEPRLRGLHVSGMAGIWIGGSLIMNIIGSYLSIKVAALMAGATPIVLMLTFVWMPESPYYLLSKNDDKRARKCLITLRGNDDVEEEISRINNGIQRQIPILKNVVDLFGIPSNRSALFIVLGIRGLQQACGITVVVLFAQLLFQEGDSPIPAHISSSIFFALYLFLTCICSTLVDRTGRKPLLLMSVVGTFLMLVLESVYFYIYAKTDIDTSSLAILPTLGLFLYVAFFSIGMQGIPTLLMGELFAVNVKPIAVCISIVWFGAIVTATSKVFQITKDNYGVWAPFAIFTAFSFITLLFIVKYVPETNGKTLEDIQEWLKSKNNCVST